MADGGDGTARAFAHATSSKLVYRTVRGPLGRNVRAHFAWNPDSGVAVIEMAQAAGLWQVPLSERNPLRTTTYGVGQLIKAALSLGAQRILIGLGGSATVDGGAGMAQSLGWQLLDPKGAPIAAGGDGLLRLDRIIPPKTFPQVEFQAATDVTNPLLGKTGAAAVFGPQKGASPRQVRKLEAGLEHLARCMERDCGRNIRELPGAGAAGGMGAACAVFLNARLLSGIGLFLHHTHFADHLAGADLVLTGEGALDRQTMHGKAPAGVAHAAQEHSVPVIGIAGCLGEGWQSLVPDPFAAVFSIAPGPITLAESQEQCARLVADRTEAIARLLSIS